jgi:hypothetical protein
LLPKLISTLLANGHHYKAHTDARHPASYYSR